LETSIARPLIAKRQVEIAKLTGADAVAHGATRKRSLTQVQISSLGYLSLNPEITVIASLAAAVGISKLSTEEKPSQELARRNTDIPS